MTSLYKRPLLSQRKPSRCVRILSRSQQADRWGVSHFKEPEQVERSLDVECIISSLTSWVLCKTIVLSVLCSLQRNKEPFETKKAKCISQASKYRCKPAASRRGSAAVTSDKCKPVASRRGSAAVSSARVIFKVQVTKF